MEQNIWISVSNDLFNDNRVQKTCQTLQDYGLNVIVLCKKNKFPQSDTSHFNFRTYRVSTIFHKNAIYYAELNIKLFFYLLFHKENLLWANDLDTLLPNFLISKIKGIPLIFDSHEMFAYTAELNTGSYQQKFWLFLEKFLVPRTKHIITVCNSIQDYFKTKYNANSLVVRNVPYLEEDSIQSKQYPLKDKYIIWQGAANKDRGLEELVESMQYINCKLIILGRGDIINKLKNIIKQYKLDNKVFILGRKDFQTMMKYTRGASLGISIDKPTNQNYKISLPNKIFEYINTATPILSSQLTEIAKIIDQYHVGIYIQSYEPKILAKQINDILANEQLLDTISKNCIVASKNLCWQNEQKVITKLVENILIK